MIDRKLEQLMWQDIDGTIGPADRDHLFAHLEKNADAKNHYESLIEFSGVLSGVGEIDPPGELRERIHSALDEVSAPASARRQETPRPSVPAFLAFRAVLRYSYVALAGIVIGAIGYHLVNYEASRNRALDISSFYGTMSKEHDPNALPELRIELDGVNGSLALRRDNSLILSRLDLRSEEEIEFILEYDGTSFQFGGLEDGGKPGSSISVEENRIRLTNRGSGRYFFAFQIEKPTDAPITVTIRAGRGAGGHVLLQEDIRPENIPARSP